MRKKKDVPPNRVSGAASTPPSADRYWREIRLEPEDLTRFVVPEPLVPDDVEITEERLGKIRIRPTPPPA